MWKILLQDVHYAINLNLLIESLDCANHFQFPQDLENPYTRTLLVDCQLLLGSRIVYLLYVGFQKWQYLIPTTKLYMLQNSSSTIPSRPCKSISMDFISGLLTTLKKHDCIFVVVCRFSKMAICNPCNKTIDASKSIEFFFQHLVSLTTHYYFQS